MARFVQLLILMGIIYIITVIIYISPSLADVVTLSDGMLVSGKITKITPEKVLMDSPYGTYIIEKKYIKDVYETSNSSEDVEIYKRIKNSERVEDIREDYPNGFNMEEEMNKSEGVGFYYYDLDLSFAPAYYSTVGKMGRVLPNGYGVAIRARLGLENIIYDSKHYYLPDIGADFCYIRFEQDPASVTGFSLVSGPVWLFPVIKNHRGLVRVSAFPGITFLNVKGEDFEGWSNTFTMSSGVGYEYPLEEIALSLFVKYLYIYDERAPLHGIGIGLGIRYNIGNYLAVSRLSVADRR